MDEDYYEDEGGFDFEEEFEYEEQEFKEEKGAFERAGGGAHLIGIGLKYVTNPIEKFKIIVNAVFNESKFSAGMGEGDLKVMMDKVPSINKVQFKNPPCYVLGYIASRGGREITKERLDLAESLISDMSTKEDVITPPDIIRYAVFWLNLNPHK
jgi:hypothetical protein